MTIRQDVGDVTIEAEPERIVALDFPSADAALALGVVPIGMAELSYLEGGVQEWTAEALEAMGADEPELLNTDEGFPFEALARLKPDVILATGAYPLVENSWEQLNAIAPVVAHVEEAGQDPWQDTFTKIAAALGKDAEGERILDEIDQEVADARADTPEFEDATATFFNYVDDTGLYVINTNDDVSLRFVTDLGFDGAPETVLDLASNAASGEARAQVSPERYDVLEADVILGTSSDGKLADLEEDPLFASVAAVERGGYLGLDIGDATSMAFPSVLSVPFALGEVVPQIADAVRAPAVESTSAP